VKKTLIISSLFLISSWSSTVFSITEEQIQHENFLTQLAKDRCSSELIEGSDYSTKILGDGKVEVSFFGKTGGEVDGTFIYESNEWKGRQRVIKEHQNEENVDHRRCKTEELISLRESYKPPPDTINKSPITYGDLRKIKPSLQIDAEEKQGFFSSKYKADYTLMVSNPFPNSDILCSVSVKSFYYVDITTGGGNRKKVDVAKKTHSEIRVKAGRTKIVKGKIKFLDKGSLGGRTWIETNQWIYSDNQGSWRQLDHPGGVRLESCVFIS
jgi:hypothetical protein